MNKKFLYITLILFVTALFTPTILNYIKFTNLIENNIDTDTNSNEEFGDDELTFIPKFCNSNLFIKSLELRVKIFTNIVLNYTPNSTNILSPPPENT